MQNHRCMMYMWSMVNCATVCTDLVQLINLIHLYLASFGESCVCAAVRNFEWMICADRIKGFRICKVSKFRYPIGWWLIPNRIIDSYPVCLFFAFFKIIRRGDVALNSSVRANYLFRALCGIVDIGDIFMKLASINSLDANGMFDGHK